MSELVPALICTFLPYSLRKKRWQGNTYDSFLFIFAYYQVSHFLISVLQPYHSIHDTTRNDDDEMPIILFFICILGLQGSTVSNVWSLLKSMETF